MHVVPKTIFGILQPVLFSPEEIVVVKGSPAGRRSLVDRGIFQTDVRYLALAREFDRHLRQRNKLLREACSNGELEPWNEGFIRTGARMRWERFRYIQRLRPIIRETYCHITGHGEEADLRYGVGDDDENALADALRVQLMKVSANERRLGQSLAGPQRDDIEMTVNGHPLRQYGSQGQQRSFVLAIKAAQMTDLESITGQTPVLASR